MKILEKKKQQNWSTKTVLAAKFVKQFNGFLFCVLSKFQLKKFKISFVNSDTDFVKKCLLLGENSLVLRSKAVKLGIQNSSGNKSCKLF
jgi:hypothetical protein